MEREAEKDLRADSGPPLIPSEDFFLSCNDVFVNDRLLLEEPPWLAIVAFNQTPIYYPAAKNHYRIIKSK